MIPLHIPGRVRVYAALWAAFAIVACSSDPRSPLGSDNDLTRSKPGVVFADTINLEGDTVLTSNSVIAVAKTLDFGRVGGYQYSMVLQFPFSSGTQDSVIRAQLRMDVADIDGTIPARFYLQPFAFANGDSIGSLDTLTVIPDPTTGGITRTMQPFPRLYDVPPIMVQDWLRRKKDRTAISVIFPPEATKEIAAFHSGEADSVALHPAIVATFADSTHTYKIGADANFIRPTTTTSHLIVSDGYVRRIHFRMPLDQLAERSAVHNARVRLYIVPGSTKGTAPNLIVFIPASDDPTTKDFTQGQLVTTVTYQASADYMEFTMTNAIALMLQGALENNGFTIRYDAENTQLRQVEFYGSDAPDSLRPRVLITSSTPADFDPDEEP